MTTIELLEKLTSLAGVAGDEKCSFEIFKGLFSPYGEVSCDNAGNIIIEKSGDEKGDESNQLHRYHEKPDGDGFVCMKPEAMKNIGNGIGSVTYQIQIKA